MTPITFTYAGFNAASQNVTSCDVCGALILEQHQELHTNYHGDLNQKYENIVILSTRQAR